MIGFLRPVPPAIVLLALLACLAAGQSKASPEKGNEIFDEQCSRCHEYKTMERKTGPSLKLLFAKEKLESSGKPVTEANIIERIEKGGEGMPAFKEEIAKEDLANLIAYLKTI